jgi:hypothetical protein
MSTFYRIFGSIDVIPAVRDVERCLAAAGVQARFSWETEGEAWYRAEIALAEPAPLVLERWLAEEEGIRGELNAWAAYLETCESSPEHVVLMERAIQTRQLFTLSRPEDQGDEAQAEHACAALCRHLAQATQGFYQADGAGFFAADGTLLVPEE